MHLPTLSSSAEDGNQSSEPHGEGNRLKRRAGLCSDPLQHRFSTFSTDVDTSC